MAALNSTVGLIYAIKADDSDARKSVSDLRGHIDKETKGIEESSKNAFLSLGKSIGLTDEQVVGLGKSLPVVGAVAAGIAGLAGIAVGAAVKLFELANAASEYGSEIKDASDKTGLSAETISTLKFAADSAGSGLEAISGSVTKFSKLIGSAAEGSKEAKESLIRLGLDPKKAINDLDGSLEKVFKQIFDAKNPIVATKLATEAFGKSGADLIPVIKQMNGDFAAFKEEAKRLGIVLTDSDAAAADDFGDSLAQLQAQARGVAFQFAKEFMPDITKAMKDVGEWFSMNRETIAWWGREVKSEILTAIDLINKLRTAWQFLTVQRSGNLFDGTFGQARETEIAQLPKPQITPEEKPRDDVVLRPLSEGGSKSKSSGGETVGQEMRKTFQELGFHIERTFGKSINEGSLHPAGKAIDLGFAGKSKEEIVNALAVGLEKGWRLVDERIVGAYPGIKSTGPNIHFEKGQGVKPSLFLDASQYGGADQLAYLKKLDADRLNKKSSTDDVAVFAEKRIAEEKKASDEIVKLREEADGRVLGSAKNTADEQKAINENLLAKKIITQEEFDKRSEQISLDLLTKEKTLAEERLALAKQHGTDTTEIEQQIADVTSQIKVKQTEEETKAYLKSRKYAEDLKALRLEVLKAERDAFDQQKEQERRRLEDDADNSFGSDRLTALIVLREFEIAENLRRKTEAIEDAQRERDAALLTIGDKVKEKEKVEEINKLYQNRLDIINNIHQSDDENTDKGLNPAIRTAAGGGGLLGILTGGLGQAAGGGVDPNNEITDKAERMKAVYNDLKETAKGAISSMVQGLGQLVSTWITTGKFSAKAALQMASSIITGLAIQSGIKALYEIAEGYAMLANPFTAALAPGHFAAAAAYGTVAAAAGAVGVGLGLASRAFGQQTATGANNPATGGVTGGNGSQTGGREFTGGAYSQYGDEVKTYESGANNPVQRHEILVGNEKYIFDVLENSASKNGRMRDLFRHLADGTT